MVQRIQTVYLFISALLIASLMKLKFADLSVNNELYTFIARGIYTGENLVFDGLAIFIFIWLIALLHFVIIFLYKKRILQIRILVFTIVLLLGLFGMFFYFTYAGFTDVKVAFKIPVVFPVIAAVLDYLAVRAIGKDEALVRSLNRIR
ncbi:MAG: hypothetical protein FD181_1061 [Prolixibacteraceae bacterium]|nr:MAG: hypothetical protein FD181_1061 [Prolixibacteraceae bacterium]